VNYRPSACYGIAVFALLRPWYTHGGLDSTRSTYDGLVVYHLVAVLLTTRDVGYDGEHWLHAVVTPMTDLVTCVVRHDEFIARYLITALPKAEWIATCQTRATHVVIKRK
jgi:hypothetical protein